MTDGAEVTTEDLTNDALRDALEQLQAWREWGRYLRKALHAIAKNEVLDPRASARATLGMDPDE